MSQLTPAAAGEEKKQDSHVMLPQGVWHMARSRGEQRGTLRVEGHSWIAYWKEWLADPSDPEMKRGRWAQKSRRVADSTLGKKAAQKIFQEEVLSGLNRFVAHPGAAVTLGQFWETKYSLRLAALARNTRIQYGSMMKNHILPTLRDLSLRDVNRLDRLQALANVKRAANLSWQTVTHIMSVLEAVISYAMELECLPDGRNAASRVDCGEKKRVCPNRAYRASESQAILAGLREVSLREYTAALTGMLTGLGQAELLGLHWRHVNLTGNDVIVGDEQIAPWRAAVRHDFTAGELRGVKRDKRRREVAISTQLAIALSEWRSASKFTSPDHPVFCNQNGGYLDGHNVANRVFRPLARKLGVKINWHSFRHTAVTNSERVMTGSDRQAMAGHSSAAMTAHYTHADLARQQESMQLMADNMMAPPPPVQPEPAPVKRTNVIEFRRKTG